MKSNTIQNNPKLRHVDQGDWYKIISFSPGSGWTQISETESYVSPYYQSVDSQLPRTNGHSPLQDR